MSDHRTPEGDERAARNNLRRSLVLVAVACVALIVALVVGTSDNLPGLALVYVASTSLMLAFAHRWRTTKRFLVLLGVGLAGFLAAAVLHNVFYGLGELWGQVAVVKAVMEALHVTFFLVAIFVCPAAALVGALGSLIAWRRSA